MKIQGKRSGPGLKPGLNMADTGSVVNTVTSSFKTGRSMASGPYAGGPSRNNMVSANASKRSGRGR